MPYTGMRPARGNVLLQLPTLLNTHAEYEVGVLIAPSPITSYFGKGQKEKQKFLAQFSWLFIYSYYKVTNRAKKKVKKKL